MRRTNRGCGVPAQGPHRHAAAALSAAVGRRRALVRARARTGEGARSRQTGAADESYARPVAESVAPLRVRRYRWTILAAGVVAQASFSAILLGLPAIAPAVQHGYGLTLPQVGVVLAALNFGLVFTLLPWGLVADRIGERAELGAGLGSCAVALVVAGRTTSYGALVGALAVAGALGGGVQSASGRAVMSWFAPAERGLALGIRQTAVPLGGAIAAGVLPALSTHVSLRAAFDALAGGCAFAAVLSVVLLRAETTGEAHGETASRPLRDRRVWVLS